MTNGNINSSLWLRTYHGYALISELGCLIYLLLIPGDPHNNFILGYSRSRLLLAAGLALLFLVTAALLIRVLRNYPFADQLSRLLYQTWAALTALLVFAFSGVLIILAWLDTWQLTEFYASRFVAERLVPVLLCALLLSLGLLLLQRVGMQRSLFQQLQTSWQKPVTKITASLETITRWLEISSPLRISLLGVLLLLPILFYMPLTFDYAPGAAGLYSLIADVIHENHFLPPQSIPYYGPGGIPFAYPPLGFFLMAALEQLGHVTPFNYVLFSPADFAALAMIPLSLTAQRLSGSWAGALAAVTIAGTSRVVMLVHLTAGGAIRGLAFFFALVSIYLFISAAASRRLWRVITAGLFAGLTALSHFSYAEFLLLFYLVYLMGHVRNRQIWQRLGLAGLTAAVVVAPWSISIYQQVGLSAFAGAFGSHGNDYFLTMVTRPELILPWIENTLRPVTRETALSGLLLLGSLYAIVSRKAWLVVWLALVLFFSSEGSRYVVVITALMASLLVTALYQAIAGTRQTDDASRPAYARAAAFLALLLAFFYWQGWLAVTRSFPPVHIQQLNALAEVMRSEIPEGSAYLSVTGDDDAEWLPYLARRTPAIGTWGAEWLGAYPQQLDYVYSLNECLAQDSLSCVEDLIARAHLQPDYLVTWYTQAAINRGLSAGGTWQAVYENEDFILWKK